MALLTVHMLNTGDDEASWTARASYLNAARPLLQDVEAVYFEGKMDFSRLSFLDRAIAKIAKAIEADHWDWGQIRGWANATWSERHGNIRSRPMNIYIPVRP